MPGRSSFGRWNRKTGEFEWKDSVMPVGPRRARMAGLPMNLRLYTTRETAVILRHSIYWVRDQIKAGKIKAIRLGSGYYVTVLEIARQMGMTGSRPGDVCWNGSENFGKRIPRRRSPASVTPGNDMRPGDSTVAPAVSGRAIFTSAQPAVPSVKVPRPLITSPGK